ncbi:MAG: hypothetical protein C4292_04895 [Nitrososphaera sp.]
MPEAVQLIKVSEFRIQDVLATGITPQAFNPHALTERFRFTVPAGSILYRPNIYAKMLRNIAPTTLGFAEMIISISKPAGTTTRLGEVVLYNAALFSFDRLILPFQYSLPAGFQIVLQTYDNSVGGSIFYTFTLTGLLLLG